MSVVDLQRQRPKYRVTTTNPTVDDGVLRGFQPLSLWENSASGEFFICKSNAVGAAVWYEFSTSSGGGVAHVSAIDPTVDDDETQGFDAGDLWENTTDHGMLICFDPAEGAADWVVVSRG